MDGIHKSPNIPVKLGISACLLGQKVRFDGGHKRDPFITDVLSRYMEFIPVCPETAIGLGIPRPSIRLTGTQTNPRATGSKSPLLDVTDELKKFARHKSVESKDISGYIVKRGSPSCGMERVKVYSPDKGMPVSHSGGIFTRTLQEHRPLLPVEEEGRLNDPVLRENFINRVYVYHRWQQLVDTGITPAALVAFHTDHKYMIMSHCQKIYRELGRLISNLSVGSIGSCSDIYIGKLMLALVRRVNRPRHSNVLQHISGYLKRYLGKGDKVELRNIIDAYRHAEVPLVVPVTLLKHHFRHYPNSYIGRQHYLNPYPEALCLRNAL